MFIHKFKCIVKFIFLFLQNQKFFTMKFSLFLILVLVSFSSCKKRGCTDPDALNFQESAAKDDHSCYYFWIGQKSQGGRVFYINPTKKHGLIAADFDLENTQWGCHGDSIEVAGINDVSVGSGNSNSQTIANLCGYETAAGKCLLLDTFGFDDWYLPSMEEMRGVSENLGKVGQGNLTTDYYWSSTQVNAKEAYLIMNANRSPAILAKGVPYQVRPIRSF